MPVNRNSVNLTESRTDGGLAFASSWLEPTKATNLLSVSLKNTLHCVLAVGVFDFRMLINNP